MAHTVEGLGKVKGQYDNIRIGIKKGSYRLEKVDECRGSRSSGLKSKLVIER